jgi:tellurite resistance protein
MTETQKDRRPRAYPAPEFPPRKPKLFARTPPAIFPAVLGLLALGLALRLGAQTLGLPSGPIEAVLGGLIGLWAFSLLALLGKVLRRPAVLVEDMKVLPGRAGLSAATISAMAAASVLVPYAPKVALTLVVLALAAHAGIAVLHGVIVARMPAEARVLNPSMHLAFVGFIVGGVPLAQMGYAEAARGILWVTMPVAGLIWAVSLVQLVRRIPPAPLRPMLAIHLAPAALFSSVAGLTGQAALAGAFAIWASLLALALIAAARWIGVAGFSALWAAFTFPLAAYATALLSLGGLWVWPGLGVLALATAAVPVIAWKVLRLWPGNKLAAKSNAAEA